MDLERDVVLGHEFCAELLDYGPGCRRSLRLGTRVCAMPLLVRGGARLIVGYSNDVPGGFGQYMVLPEPLLLEAPGGLSAELAALTEPLAVGRHAVEKARLEPGDVPLVIGCGPVGLAVIAALRSRGVGPVVASDYSPRRRELAARLGADVVVDPGEGSPYASWAEVAALAPGGVPAEERYLPAPPAQRPGVVFECVGVPGMLDAVLRQAPLRARIVVVGVCMEADRIHPVFGINKELAVQFVLGYSEGEFAQTLRDIADGRLDVAPLVTGRVGLAEVATAFRELAHPERHAKILVEPWR